MSVMEFKKFLHNSGFSIFCKIKTSLILTYILIIFQQNNYSLLFQKTLHFFETSVKLDVLLLYALMGRFGANSEWLKTGEGEMFHSPKEYLSISI
jgi:hypothetical protein